MPSWVDSWYIDEITVGSVVMRNHNGDPIATDNRTVKCRIEPWTRLVVDFRGEERRSKFRIATAGPISNDELVWTPDRDSSKIEQGEFPLRVVSAKRKTGEVTVYEVVM